MARMRKGCQQGLDTTFTHSCIVSPVMKTPADIITALGGLTIVADHLDTSISTVASWKYRSHIPSRWWEKLIAMARKKRVKGVTFPVLWEATYKIPWKDAAKGRKIPPRLPRRKIAA